MARTEVLVQQTLVAVASATGSGFTIARGIGFNRLAPSASESSWCHLVVEMKENYKGLKCYTQTVPLPSGVARKCKGFVIV